MRPPSRSGVRAVNLISHPQFRQREMCFSPAATSQYICRYMAPSRLWNPYTPSSRRTTWKRGTRACLLCRIRWYSGEAAGPQRGNSGERLSAKAESPIS